MSQGLCLLSCITVCSSWSSLSPFAHLLGFLRAHIHSLHWVPTVLFSKCSNALIQNQFHFSPWRPPFQNPPASCLNLSDWSLEQLHTQLPSGNFPWPEHMLLGPFLIMIHWGSVALSELWVEHLVPAFKEGGGQRNQHSWVHCPLGWPSGRFSSIWIDRLGPPDHQEAHTEAAGSSSAEPWAPCPCCLSVATLEVLFCTGQPYSCQKHEEEW